MELENKIPDGSQAWQTTHTYTPLWDGTIVKLTENTPERDASSEGYFYWDREEQKIAVLVVNKKGIYKKGFVTEEDGILTISGKISFPERTFDFKNAVEFSADGKMIDSWYQNAFGSWMAGHVLNLLKKIIINNLYLQFNFSVDLAEDILLKQVINYKHN